ncbi:MAG TPA: ribosome silencing factor [Clostridiaceae bacterium]|nr:ribosome silencing factor [Clostridiaceae bacterium]
MNSAELSEKISHILLDKKARDVDIIKIENLTILTDYFIICTGTSTTHIRTLADEVIIKLREEGIECHHVEGYESSRWILLDYGNVVVHIFHEEERKYYNLERLWSEGIITRKEIKVPQQ